MNAFSLIETPGLTLTMNIKKSNTELRLTLGYGFFFLKKIKHALILGKDLVQWKKNHKYFTYQLQIKNGYIRFTRVT